VELLFLAEVIQNYFQPTLILENESAFKNAWHSGDLNLLKANTVFLILKNAVIEAIKKAEKELYFSFSANNNYNLIIYYSLV
jgi:hypothetical protein